jgi:DNA-binding LacI/PurR family transcriptional regulator
VAQHLGSRDRPPTMADVAARAGVSRALVSTVFRSVPGAGPETRERVLRAAADLGYRMDNRARMLRRSRTQQLGVVFQVQDAFHSDLVEALYPQAEAAGYHLVLSATTPNRPELRAADALLDDRCEALLLVAPQTSEAQLATLSARSPTVVMSRRLRVRGVDVVRTSDHEVVAMALDHLIGLGHQRIAHVDGGTYRGSADRRRAYRTLMKRHALDAYTRVITGGATEADGKMAAAQLTSQGELPTGIIAFNDRTAVGVMFELRRAGIDVPSQVSIVGYDDVSMAGLPFIELTTVGQDSAATAHHAVQRAIARLDHNETTDHNILIPPYLAKRGTTSPPQ